MEGRDKNLLAYEIWTDSKYVETVMMLVDDRGKIILPATTVSKWREGVGSLLRFAPQDDLIARSGGIAGGVAVSWYGTSDGKIVRHVVSVGSAGDTDGNVANGYGGGDDDDSTTAATTATATSTTRTTVTTSTATSTTISTTTATATTTTTTTVVDDVADEGVGAGATNTNGGSVVVGDANADDDDDGLACKAGNHGYIADGAGAIDRSPQMSSSTTAKMSGGKIFGIVLLVLVIVAMICFVYFYPPAKKLAARAWRMLPTVSQLTCGLVGGNKNAWETAQHWSVLNIKPLTPPVF